MKTPSLITRAIAAVAALVVVLGGLATAASADGNAPPSATLSCDNDTSILTVTFPTGGDDYGSFRLADTRYGAAGTVSRPGPIAPGTVLTIVVSDGWDPVSSTFHLGWPEARDGNDERHIIPLGQACEGEPPPPPTPDIGVDCANATITITFDPSMDVTRWQVLTVEPTFSVLGFSFFGAAAGSSVTLPLPTDTTLVSVDVSYIDGRSYSATVPTACACTWTSVKDFSNVIVQYADGTEVKFDDLDGRELTIPNDPDNPIVAVWIKAGRAKLDPDDPAPITFHNNGIGVYHEVQNCELVP